jgi:hypothetical protein
LDLAFTVCEEAARVLSTLTLSDPTLVGLVLTPECMRLVMCGRVHEAKNKD